MKKKIIVLISVLLFLITVGCGEDLPFEYRYLSASVVRINYMGAQYHLNRYGSKTDTPFEYEFESDGDIDITISGKIYDIDSPYDIDKPKVSKKTIKSSKKVVKPSKEKVKFSKKKVETSKKKQ